MILTRDTAHLPLLPAFQGAEESDLILDVFTHRSLIFNPDEVKPVGFGNAERLRTLGEQALSYAVTKFYFLYKPHMPAQEITNKVHEFISGPKIVEWLNAYPTLKTRLRLSPGHTADEVLANFGEASRYIHTYIGALLYCSGPQVVDAWIFGLLSLSEEVKVEDDDTMVQDPNPLASSSSYGQAPPDYSGPPGSTSNGLPANAAASGSSSIPMSVISLSIVHETATKKRATVDYTAERAGDAHCPQWTVRCLINGELRGQGISSKQKTAKEEAARQAFVAMGWAQ